MKEPLSYKKAGVDLDAAYAAKKGMAKSLETSDPRVLNRIGPFASLYDASFPEYEHPVLVLKTEEPGSKQKLALEQGRIESICYDLVHHLVNDVIVMGARPLLVQDVIICGKLEKDVVEGLVASLADACREQDCTLTGGETSEQPGVVDEGTYVLAASIVGVVEKAKIIDGSKIEEGDIVLAVASNGLHTNGYSLVRALMTERPEIASTQVAGESFMDAIMRPHRCYYKSVRGLFEMPELHGMAHITGGGIQGNLNRILPQKLDAVIDRSRIEVLPVFKLIKEIGSIDDTDMLRTFNMGVGLTIVASEAGVAPIRKHLSETGCESYVIGQIASGTGDVRFHEKLRW